MAPVQDWHSPSLLPLLSLFKAVPQLMFTHRGICQVGNLWVYGRRFVYDKLIPWQSTKTPARVRMEPPAGTGSSSTSHFPPLLASCRTCNANEFLIFIP